MNKIDEIKKLIIELIKEKGFPVAYVVDDADSFSGHYVKSVDDVIGLGYADDGTGKHKKLINLDLVELSTLLMYGVTNKHKDWKIIVDIIEGEEEECES
jgi:hypothetical protein